MTLVEQGFTVTENRPQKFVEHFVYDFQVHVLLCYMLYSNITTLHRPLLSLPQWVCHTVKKITLMCNLQFLILENPLP